MRDERARHEGRPSPFLSAGGGPSWRRPFVPHGRLLRDRLEVAFVPHGRLLRGRLEWDAVGVVHWPTNVP